MKPISAFPNLSAWMIIPSEETSYKLTFTPKSEASLSAIPWAFASTVESSAK